MEKKSEQKPLLNHSDSDYLHQMFGYAGNLYVVIGIDTKTEGYVVQMVGSNKKGVLKRDIVKALIANIPVVIDEPNQKTQKHITSYDELIVGQYYWVKLGNKWVPALYKFNNHFIIDGLAIPKEHIKLENIEPLKHE